MGMDMDMDIRAKLPDRQTFPIPIPIPSDWRRFASNVAGFQERSSSTPPERRQNGIAHVMLATPHSHSDCVGVFMPMPMPMPMPSSSSSSSSSHVVSDAVPSLQVSLVGQSVTAGQYQSGVCSGSGSRTGVESRATCCHGEAPGSQQQAVVWAERCVSRVSS